MTRLSKTNTLVARFQQLNWVMVALIAAIALFGIAMMISAGGGRFSPWATPQIMRLAASFMLMLLIAVFPVRLLHSYAYFIYGGCLLLLLLVEALGFAGKGAQRWIEIGPVQLQPSELMKIGLILAFARYYHNTHAENVSRPLALLPPLLLALIPAVLILRQPNLGTTAILLGVTVIMLFMAGLNWKYFASVIIGGLACAPVAWHFLHDYQKQRVLTFLNPEADPLGAGYNILQSMIAIGSGGFFGKGYLQGSQGQLNFLPEKHTDFIFTMVAEEFGFLGSTLLLLSYLLLMLLGLATAIRARSIFASMLAVGVVAMLFLHLFINVAMVMGLLPVVGLPLPLLSYGGSIMLSIMIAFGLLLNAYVHRDSTLK